MNCPFCHSEEPSKYEQKTDSWFYCCEQAAITIEKHERKLIDIRRSHQEGWLPNYVPSLINEKK